MKIVVSLAEDFILCLLSTMQGRLGGAPGKIRMKSAGKSETMCFEKMMQAGAGVCFVTADVECCTATLG